MSTLPRSVAVAWALAALALFAGGGAASACSIPVFRYALERWEASAYEVVVFHQGPLSAAQKEYVEAVRSAGDASKGMANVDVRVVDVTEKMDKDQQVLWAAQAAAKPTLPWVVLRYPDSNPEDTPVWAGPMEKLPPAVMADSPARRQIANRLLAGQSAVWVLLESGQKTADDAAEATVAEESKRLEKTLKLPEIDPNDGPRLRSDLPLKLAFSVLRVSRTDPAEAAFVAMLLNLETKVAASKEPMVFAVFGRGRALPPLVGKEIHAQVIGQAAEFLTGSCSCEIKELNPGVDLLIAADWEALVENRKVQQPRQK